MSEATIRAGVIAVIRKHADFDTTNVGDNDYRIFAKGLTRAVVVETGIISDEADFSLKTISNTWLFPVSVYRQWTGEQNSSVSNLAAEAQKVKDQIDVWPQLDAVSGVLRASLRAVGQPEPIREGKGNFLRQLMECRVQEIATPSRQE